MINRRALGLCMRFRAFFKPWAETFVGLRLYFAIYGGFKSLSTSPYVHISILSGFSLVFFRAIRFGEIGTSVLPNILGFTIGAMAIVLSVATSEFFAFLAERGKPESFFMKLVANFLHYIIAQALTIIFCIYERSLGENNWFNYFAAVMFIYSILSPMAMGAQLFQMARIYNAASGVERRGQS